MKNSIIPKKVIWAIDPFEKEVTPNPEVLLEFFDWMNASGYPIQPVHVLTGEPIDPTEIDDGTWMSRSMHSGERVASNYIAQLQDQLPKHRDSFKGILAPKIPLCAEPSRKGAVKRLLSLVEVENAPLIALSSHGRSGLGRLAMGSFAENILLESEVPVLFLSHSEERKKETKKDHIRKVLFSTDFSINSKKAFRRFLPEAKALGADLVLFHAVVFPPSALDGTVPEGFFEDQEAWAKDEFKAWIAEAKSSGVNARMSVQQGGVTNQVAKKILATADEEGVELIAMASLSGAFSSFALGSVAREVFRSQKYPVWVCGPKMFDKKLNKENEEEIRKLDRPSKQAFY